MESCIHSYQEIWTPVNGKHLNCKQERGSTDARAVAIYHFIFVCVFVDLCYLFLGALPCSYGACAFPHSSVNSALTPFFASLIDVDSTVSLNDLANQVNCSVPSHRSGYRACMLLLWSR